tara:strand:- start:3507 stop:5138 length:1632 start_codon:yes stop_codon:yes gene_type:complete
MFIPLGFLSIFFIFPLINIILRGLGDNGLLDLLPFKQIISETYYLERIWFTFWQASISTILTLIIGLPVAFVFARYEFPCKELLKSLTTLPFVMPTIVVAIGFGALLGPNGLLNQVMMTVFDLKQSIINFQNTLVIIFAAHVFYNYSIVVRIVSNNWSNLDPNLEGSAKMLGAGRLRVFWYIELPLLLPSIISAALLSFIFAFSSFGVILILGGPQFATLEVTIYELTTKLFRLPLAAALCLIQISVSYLFLFLYARLQDKTHTILNFKPYHSTLRYPVTKLEKVFVILTLIMVLLILSPLVALVGKSVYVREGFSIVNFVNLFTNPNDSYFYLSPMVIIWNSIRFGVITIVISLIIGTMSAIFLGGKGKRTGLLDSLLMLPLGASAVVLGYGFLISFNRSPIDLRASWVLLVIAHSLIAYPFVIRSILPVLQSINPGLREAASVLGASEFMKIVKIDLPIISRAMLVGATFAFAVSIGEFGASMLLTRPEMTTMPISIYQSLSQPGDENIGKAMAMAVLLMMVIGTSFVAIEKIRYKGIGSF